MNTDRCGRCRDCGAPVLGRQVDCSRCYNRRFAWGHAAGPPWFVACMCVSGLAALTVGMWGAWVLAPFLRLVVVCFAPFAYIVLVMGLVETTRKMAVDVDYRRRVARFGGGAEREYRDAVLQLMGGEE